ncbi:MAG: helix-turn-helix domain-containing protein [Lachnospiraceae bacterium]|nr:helix-turn-helix domain-containing protein [Lachnospiraceae bacterium]
MIHAYDETYVEKAKTALGRMLDFAVYDLQYKLTDFWNLFLASGTADRFGNGDFTLLAGKSGVEIAYLVLEKSGVSEKRVTPSYTLDRSEEYWTGWALAWYQWRKGVPFREITKRVSIDEIRQMYVPYHEMDLRQFADKMDEKCQKSSITKLKELRMQSGLSQKELSELSGVPVRTLQQYEQKQKDINKAKTEYVYRFSKILGCRIEDLIEFF